MDSRPETYRHIQEVQRLLNRAIVELLARSEGHDQSKLVSPEVEVLDRFTPQLATVEYGSPEYHATLRAMLPGLEHHYAVNRHHPEFHSRVGIHGMDLIDLVEMLCDWIAAGKRSPNGDPRRSILINQARFGYGDELRHILENTLPLLGVMPETQGDGS